VASYQLRNRATIVGNICNASPAGDTTGASIVLDGSLTVHGAGGVRTESLKTFFLGPGKNVLKPGDIVTAITYPLPPKGWAGKYIKLGRNALSDLSIVGITVMGYPDESTKSGFRFHIALASVAPVPFVAKAAESILADKKISDAVLDEAAAVAMDGCTPIDDVRSSARYRKLMVRNLTRKALAEVWAKIK
jgi:carbon-monoxide dehydrogenase medium subunit